MKTRVSVVAVVASVSLLAGAVAHGAVRTWTGAVDATWANAGNWVDGEKPGPGDDVVVTSSAGHDVIDLGADGVSVKMIKFNGSVPMTVNGGTLTVSGGGQCWSNTVGVVSHAPVAFTATGECGIRSRPEVKNADGSGNSFYAPVTAANCTGSFYIRAVLSDPYKAPTHFYSTFSAPSATVRDNGADGGCDVHFHDKIDVKVLDFGYYNNGIKVYLYTTGNKCQVMDPYFTVTYVPLCENAFDPLGLISFCWNSNGDHASRTPRFDLNGFDQTADRINDAYSYAPQSETVGIGEIVSLVNSNGKAGETILTLKGSKDAKTQARIQSKVSIVWDPSGNFTQTFSNRVNATSGSITVKGGTVRVNGAASFKNLYGVNVAANATFDLDTTLPSALQTLSRLDVAADGKIRIGASATTPTSDGQLVAHLAAGAKIAFAGSTTLAAKYVKVGGTALADGTYVAGATTETETHADWIEGDGRVVVSGSSSYTDWEGDFAYTDTDGTTFTAASGILTVNVPAGKTNAYDYAAMLDAGVTKLVKCGQGALRAAANDRYRGDFDIQSGVFQVHDANSTGRSGCYGRVYVRDGAAIVELEGVSADAMAGKEVHLAGAGPADIGGALAFVKGASAGWTKNVNYVLDADATISHLLPKNGYKLDGGSVDVNGHVLSVNSKWTGGYWLYFDGGIAFTNSNDAVAGKVVITGAAGTWVDIVSASFTGGARNRLEFDMDGLESLRSLILASRIGGDWTLVSVNTKSWSDTTIGGPSHKSASTTAYGWNGAVEVHRLVQAIDPQNTAKCGCSTTFGGPFTGDANARLNITRGWVHFFGTGHDYKGSLLLNGNNGGVDEDRSVYRTGLTLHDGASIPVTPEKTVYVNDSDIELGTATAFALPKLNYTNGTCRIFGGPAGDAACGRATVAALTVDYAPGTNFVSAPVAVTGLAHVVRGCLKLDADKPAAVAPAFSNLVFEAGTVFDMGGSAVDVGDLTIGTKDFTILNAGTLVIHGTLTVDGTVIAAGGLDFTGGTLAFADGAKVAVTNRKSAAGKTTLVTAASVVNAPQQTADGKLFVFGTDGKLEIGARGCVLIFK